MEWVDQRVAGVPQGCDEEIMQVYRTISWGNLPRSECIGQ